MFGHIGVPELLLILAIVLLIFGANKVPEVARSLGKGIRAFRAEASKMREELEATVRVEEEEKAKAKAKESVEAQTKPEHEEVKEAELEPQEPAKQTK